MFDVGFSELILLGFVGLIVLGPKRLPIAIRTVMGWVRTVRNLAANVQSELSQELKLQELQESIKKAENLNLQQLSPELNKTVEELRESAMKIKADLERKAAESNTSFQDQVQELKQAVQAANPVEVNLNQEVQIANNSPLEKTQENFTALNTDTHTEEQLSPAELAELAEENDPMTYVSDYYPEDDLLADQQESEQSNSITYTELMNEKDDKHHQTRS